MSSFVHDFTSQPVVVYRPFQSQLECTMTCFQPQCSRDAAYWCQACSRMFCQECVDRPHHADPSMVLPEVQDAPYDGPAPTPRLTAARIFTCSRAVSWLAIIGVRGSVVLCHFCDTHEQLQHISIHCNSHRHRKRMAAFRLIHDP